MRHTSGTTLYMRVLGIKPGDDGAVRGVREKAMGELRLRVWGSAAHSGTTTQSRITSSNFKLTRRCALNSRLVTSTRTLLPTGPTLASMKPAISLHANILA